MSLICELTPLSMTLLEEPHLSPRSSAISTKVNIVLSLTSASREWRTFLRRSWTYFLRTFFKVNSRRNRSQMAQHAA